VTRNCNFVLILYLRALKPIPLIVDVHMSLQGTTGTKGSITVVETTIVRAQVRMDVIEMSLQLGVATERFLAPRNRTGQLIDLLFRLARVTFNVFTHIVLS
jgi:hypothetical protein